MSEWNIPYFIFNFFIQVLLGEFMLSLKNEIYVKIQIYIFLAERRGEVYFKFSMTIKRPQFKASF